MTDVKAAACSNHCCGREPGLQGCHSELVRAGLKLSSHSFSLALHIRSLVPCRICVLAAASGGRRTFFFFLHAANLESCTLLSVFARARTHSHTSASTQLLAESHAAGAKKDIQLGIKTDTSHNIKFARISASPAEW